MPVRAVVPIGGQAFVAPRICPEGPVDDATRPWSFAATRAKRCSLDQAPTGRTAQTSTHQRSVSMPHVEACPDTPEKPKPKPTTSSRTRPSRRLRNFHLHLPPEAEVRLREWQASVRQDPIQNPATSPPSAPRSPQPGDADVRVAFPRAESPSCRRRCKRSSYTVAEDDLTHLSVETTGLLLEEGKHDMAPAGSPAMTPELVSTPSSPTNTVPRTPSPCHARARSTHTSSEWYIKQDAYASQMHAHTEKMWNRQRQLFEYAAAAGLTPAPPRCANGSSRPWPMTQAQQARQEAAQAKVQRALHPTKSRSPRWPKPSRSPKSASPSPPTSGQNSKADPPASVPFSSSSRSPSARGSISTLKQGSNARSWTRLLHRMFA